jgi:hypothetical protein
VPDTGRVCGGNRPACGRGRARAPPAPRWRTATPHQLTFGRSPSSGTNPNSATASPAGRAIDQPLVYPLRSGPGMRGRHGRMKLTRGGLSEAVHHRVGLLRSESARPVNSVIEVAGMCSTSGASRPSSYDRTIQSTETGILISHTTPSGRWSRRTSPLSCRGNARLMR